MPTVAIAFGAMNADSIPALSTYNIVSEALTPSASNQATTAASTASLNMVRVATDTAVWVAFGATPDATTAAARLLLPANGIEYFRVGTGVKVAVVNA